MEKQLPKALPQSQAAWTRHDIVSATAGELVRTCAPARAIASGTSHLRQKQSRREFGSIGFANRYDMLSNRHGRTVKSCRSITSCYLSLAQFVNSMYTLPKHLVIIQIYYKKTGSLVRNQRGDWSTVEIKIDLQGVIFSQNDPTPYSTNASMQFAESVISRYPVASCLQEVSTFL